VAISTSGCHSLSQSFRDTTRHARKAQVHAWPFGISMLRIVWDISISGLDGHITTSGCCSLLKSFMNSVIEHSRNRFAVGHKHIVLRDVNKKCWLIVDWLTFVVFLIKRMRLFCPQTQYVCIKEEAQYDD